MELPTEKTTKVGNLDMSTILLYGSPKIGKSTIAASFPKPLFAAAEEGLKFIDAFKVGISTWEDFVELRKRLTEKPHDFRTLIVDTVDVLFQLCTDYACKKLGVEHPADSEWGRGFDAVRTEFQRQIFPLAASDKAGRTRFGIVFISHEKTAEIRGRVVKTLKTMPTIPNGARKIIMPLVDIIGYCGYDKDVAGDSTDKRCVWFEPSDQVEAGDRTGCLPAKLPMTETGWYENFQRAFKTGGKSEQAAPKPKVKARAEA